MTNKQINIKPLKKNRLIGLERILITIGIIILMGASFFAGIQVCKLYNEMKYFDFSYVEQFNSNNNTSLVISDDEEGQEATSSMPYQNDNSAHIIIGVITAYTVRPEEGTNCISASQRNICWKDELFCACPVKYEFGTRFLIAGDVWTCVDRMNKYHRQFDNHFDLFYEDDLAGALEFGRQELEVKIIN